MIEEENKPVTIKSLKKEFDEFKKDILARLPETPLKPVHAVAPYINPEDVQIGEAEDSITFHFTDRFKEPRIFSFEINGPEWKELAEAFHTNNQDKIKKRENN